MHDIDVALQQLDRNATPEQRLQTIWQAYEKATSTSLQRPPTDAQRQAVHTWMKDLRRNVTWPLLTAYRDTFWFPVSLSLHEKVSKIAQAPCGACEIFADDSGRMPLNVLFPVDIDPWSRQASKKSVEIRALVNDELARRSYLQVWEGPVCVTVASLVPRSKVGRKDSDNLVKGLLDAMEDVLYANDRQIQCLTSRRVEYAGSVGLYMVSAKAVYPWDADTIFDDPAPPKVVSGNRISLSDQSAREDTHDVHGEQTQLF